MPSAVITFFANAYTEHGVLRRMSVWHKTENEITTLVGRSDNNSNCIIIKANNNNNNIRPSKQIVQSLRGTRVLRRALLSGTDQRSTRAASDSTVWSASLGQVTVFVVIVDTVVVCFCRTPNVSIQTHLFGVSE